MANFQTSYVDDDEDRVLREFLALQGGDPSVAAPVEAPAQDANVPPLEEPPSPDELPPAPGVDDPDAVFAQYAQTPPPAGMRSSYVAPPHVKEKDNTWAWIAAALDLGLNRGENMAGYISQLGAGGDAAQENWKRDNDAMNAASMRDARTQAYGAKSGNAALQQKRLELAQQNAELRAKQIEQQGAGLELRGEQNAVKNSATHPQTLALIDKAYKNGWAEPGTLDGLTWEQVKSQIGAAGRNAADLAMADDINAVAADKAAGVAQATEGSKLRVAEGTARVTQPYKVDLAREQAGIRVDDKETAAALEESKTVNAERRKRAALQEDEKTKLHNLLAQLEERDENAALPGQGNIASRAAIGASQKLLGGTGMNEADSQLDNELTMAGLVAYVSEGHNAPNSEREQDVAGRKFRGDGTVAGAKASIRARLQALEKAEGALRTREESERIKPKPRAQNRPAASREQIDAEREVDDLYGGF